MFRTDNRTEEDKQKQRFWAEIDKMVDDTENAAKDLYSITTGFLNYVGVEMKNVLIEDDEVYTGTEIDEIDEIDELKEENYEDEDEEDEDEDELELDLEKDDFIIDDEFANNTKGGLQKENKL